MAGFDERVIEDMRRSLRRKKADIDRTRVSNIGSSRFQSTEEVARELLDKTRRTFEVVQQQKGSRVSNAAYTSQSPSARRSMIDDSLNLIRSRVPPASRLSSSNTFSSYRSMEEIGTYSSRQSTRSYYSSSSTHTSTPTEVRKNSMKNEISPSLTLPDLNSDDEPEVQIEIIQKCIDRMTIEIKQYQICQVCSVPGEQYASVPCGHIMCSNCCAKKSSCPKCGKVTTDRLKIYLEHF